MQKAIWNDVILAESDKTVKLEGNQYFPLASLDQDYFRESDYQTVCPWKGRASYYDIIVDGEVNKNAAWYYPDPSSAAQQIKGHVAFWNGVKVSSSDDASDDGNGSVLGRMYDKLRS